MKQIRIYYECLEQAFDYIKPIIESVIDTNTEIILVKRPKTAKQLNIGAIAAMQSITTPDILITGISNNIEYPLVLIEFTEAVTTEDHELQRTYGAVGAYLAGMYYVKLSGDKQSEKEFGGAKYNPYSTPKIFIEKVDYEGYIIANWDTQSGNRYTLQRNKNLPACPPEIPILKDTLQKVVSVFLQSEKEWFANSLHALKQTDSYKAFLEKVARATGANELLKTWSERRDTNLNKLRYFVHKKWVGAKINRFSHAMDPDRGILTFMSFIFSEAYKIYGIYALVRARGNDILKADLTNLKSLQAKLNEALDKDSCGVPEWFISELKTVAKTAKTINKEINFQPIWQKHKNKITQNKVVMTIAFFLDGMYLNHNGIKLYWDRKALLGDSQKSFLPLIRDYFGFSKYTKPTNITQVYGEVDEDEVTYAIAHRVLIPNNFRIISISYPGAQGGSAILPDPNLGKSQPREYPDIIALPPNKNKNIDAILNESKGMFNKSQVEKDTKKILRYKNDKNLQRALKETLVVAKVVDEKDNIKNIIIGVSFGTISNATTNWRPDEVDFIFRITNRENWAIGIFNQALRDLIPTIEGNTNFPKVYIIAKNGKAISYQLPATSKSEAFL